MLHVVWLVLEAGGLGFVGGPGLMRKVHVEAESRMEDGALFCRIDVIFDHMNFYLKFILIAVSNHT